MDSPELLSIFIAPLEQNEIAYFITGSIAAIFYGEPRLTHDIDVVIHPTQADLSRFPSLFPIEDFYCPPEEVLCIEAKRRPFGHFNLIHHQSGLKADIYPDVDDRLHQWAFTNRRRVNIQDTLSIWLAPPEYVIIRKLEYFREGESNKHLEDIRKMLPQVGFELNTVFLEKELKTRGLMKYWPVGH